MSYAATINRTWQENILFSALVELTYRCNLDCSFCYNDTALQGTPLTLSQYVRFLEDLRDLGTLNLTLSGGEPLAHPEFFALGRIAREMGFLVRVKTNAHALRGRLAERMRDEVDPFMLEVSLHGATAATHDRQTRVPGSFDRLIMNLRGARVLGLRVKLNAPMTVWNEHEAEAMYELADALDIYLDIDPQITGRDNGDMSPLQIGPSRAGISSLYRAQEKRTAAMQLVAADLPPEPVEAPQAGVPGHTSDKHCGAGSMSVIVDPFGNVYPCVQWRRSIGNLHQSSIKVLWNNSDTLAEVRRIAVEVGESVAEQGAGRIGFCPGSAEREAGSPTKLYPIARLLVELKQRSVVP